MGEVLRIVGTPAALDDLIHVAGGMDVTIGEPVPLDASGDGLDFPIDPASAFVAFQVVSTAVSTAAGVVALLEAWRDRRRRGSSPGPAKSDLVVVASLSGEVLYQGELDAFEPADLRS